MLSPLQISKCRRMFSAVLQHRGYTLWENQIDTGPDYLIDCFFGFFHVVVIACVGGLAVRVAHGTIGQAPRFQAEPLRGEKKASN